MTPESTRCQTPTGDGCDRVVARRLSEVHIRPDEIAVSKRGMLINYSHGLTLRWLRTERWCYLWRKAWYEGELHPYTPLMWWDEELQLFCMPDRHAAETDLGSIPPPLRGAFPQDEFPFAYYFHDRGYGEGGLYVAPTLDAPFKFREFSRSWLDDRCLSAMPQALGTIRCRTGAIWGAVRTFGGFAWDPVTPR